MSGTGNTTKFISQAGDWYDGVMSNVAWGDAEIFYSFPTSSTVYSYSGANLNLVNGFNVVTSQQVAVSQFALDADLGTAASAGFSVEGFTDVQVSLGDPSSTTAEIRIANTTANIFTAQVADFPGNYNTSNIDDNGDVWFGPYQSNVFRTPEAGNYAWLTHLHEFGHALGLVHGQDGYLWGPLPANLDSMEFSVMTYRSYVGASVDGGYTNGPWDYAQTWMMGDIAALQHMYGADFTTNSGDTVYSWSPASGDTLVNGAIAIDAGGSKIFATVWDGGGIDTYDLSAYTTAVSIDLAPGGYSVFSSSQQASLGDGNVARGNIFNALQYQNDSRSLIENAIGGSGSDTISGNAADNLLLGGAGTGIDTLNGLGGNDTLDGGDGNDLLYGGTGNDTLIAGFGSDLFDGGADIDTFLIAGSAVDNIVIPFNINLTTGLDQYANSYVSIENVTGGVANDTLTGDANDNVFEGGAGNDTLNGGVGNDTASYANASGNVRVDLSFSGTGQDTISAGIDTLSNFENLLGSDYNDFLIGDDLDNVITGGLGADGIIGGAGADTLDGGDDDALIDTVRYETSDAAVVVNLETGFADGGHATGDVITNFEAVIGSAFDDALTGDADPNNLFGFGGNDVLEGRGGADQLFGDADSDTASYAGSAQAVQVSLGAGTATGGDAEGDSLFFIENLRGSAGNDTLTGDANDNVLEGGNGDDTLDGGAGNDTASYAGAGAGIIANLTLSGAGQDTVSAGVDTLSNVENLTGSAFADLLVGDGLVNVISGGNGADRIEGGAGGDTLDGGDDDLANDYVDYQASGAAVVVNLDTGFADGGHATGDVISNFEGIFGSGFDDTLTGDADTNFLEGGGGNDVLEGLGGADLLLGDAGSDTASYASSAAAVDVNLGAGTAFGGDAEGDTLTDIENLAGSAFNDFLRGDDLDNALAGGLGADQIVGGIGGDTLDGGDDDLANDYVDYQASDAAVVVNLDTGFAVGGHATGDVISNFEGIFGSGFDDTLTGDADTNFLEGGGGNDVLEGLGGADLLLGGAGSDTASYASSAAAVDVNLGAGTATGGDAEGDTLINIENLAGSAGNDTLTGDASDNVIEGGNGDDTLDGGAGNDTATYALALGGVLVSLSASGFAQDTFSAGIDTLSNFENLVGSDFDDLLVGDDLVNVISGGDGADQIAGGGGGDTLDGGDGDGLQDLVDYQNSDAAVEVSLETGFADGGHATGDVIANFEGIFGSGFGDTLTGDAAGNVLLGRGGNDVLEGLGGADQLFGDAGSDTASYASSAAAVQVDLGAGTATGGDAEGDTLTNIENLAGSAGNDTLTGDANDNVIEGGGGDDTLDGGGGNDTVSYALAGAAVTVDLSLPGAAPATGGAQMGFGEALGRDGVQGNAGPTSVMQNDLSIPVAGQGTGGAGNDTLANFENITGSAFDDVLIGDDLDNVISGGLGFDQIEGGAGGDTLDGGDDDAETDYVIYANSDAAVIVNLDTGFALGGHATGDQIANFEATIGSEFNDTLTGDDGINGLFGNGGNDFLEGLGGADVLFGGDGSSDTASYASSGEAVQVDLVIGEGTGGDAEGDTLVLIENLTGSGFDDTLTGDVLDNFFDGGAGNDTLIGGGGDDFLGGNAGVDQAVAQGSQDEYAALRRGTEAVVIDSVAARDGTDTLVDVESMLFTGDGTVVAFEEVATALEYTASYEDLMNAFGTDADAAFQHFKDVGASEGRGVTFDGIEYVAGYDDLILSIGTDVDAAAAHFISTGFGDGRAADAFDARYYLGSYADLRNAFGTDQETAALHFVVSGFAEGRERNDFDPLEYIASYDDLIGAFGTDAALGNTHFLDAGFSEGRGDSFDGLDYIASFGDLIGAFGTNGEAGTVHYINAGRAEGRQVSFDGLEYLASYDDLILAYGDDQTAAAQHYIAAGFAEGRSSDAFDGRLYLGGYADLRGLFGTNETAAAEHFVVAGFAEGRARSEFDPLEYIASYGDLINAFGVDATAGTTHFLDAGFYEGRGDNFDGLEYIASYGDLIVAFGTNEEAGTVHYITTGNGEGRMEDFDPQQYLDNYADLQAAFGSDLEAATLHYITAGYFEGRTDDVLGG